MKGECNLFDVEMLVDLTVEFTKDDGASAKHDVRHSDDS